MLRCRGWTGLLGLGGVTRAGWGWVGLLGLNEVLRRRVIIKA
jgi:hypothetical protein